MTMDELDDSKILSLFALKIKMVLQDYYSLE